MQAKRGYLHGAVSLSTHAKRKPRTHPVWELRYRLPSGKNSDKVLGKAHIDVKLWEAKNQVKHLGSRPPEGLMTERQAQAAAQAFLDEHASAVPADRKTFARAWQDFLAQKERVRRPLKGSTLHEYSRIYDELAQRPWRNGLTWAQRPIADFEPADANRVYDELEERGLRSSTINHHRRIVRACIGNHITRDWPFLSEQSDESAGKIRFYTPDQVALLVAHGYDATDRAIYTLATQAGLRMSEILALKVGNVDLEQGRVRIEDGYTRRGGHGSTKGHQVRSVPLSEQVHTALLPFCQRRGADELVFSRPDGGPMCGGGLYRRFLAAAKRAGLPRRRFHDLRHSFGTMAVRLFSVYEVQQMMGHKSITTTERYLHYAPDPEAARKLSRVWSVEGAEIVALPTINRGGRPAVHPGGCPKCGDPKAPGQPYCVEHQRESREASNARRKAG